MPDAPSQPPTTDATPPPALPDLTGRVLGDYHLLRKLGVGGMGQVYLARQLSLKRDVAVKLLRGELSTNTTALKRFQAEAEAVAKLNHPNIVHIHQIGDQDGLRYMVLEYVDGRNLRDYLARKGPPDLAISLTIIRQVVLALQKAHGEGIVHRDIKPENILVTRKVEVKVADFGLSRYFAGDAPATNLTQSGLTLGTPLYMAPEQVQGHPTDNRTDIYSLGVTCYHLLAGEPPFRGATAFDVALKHVQEQPRPLSDLRPDLPAEMCGMVHKMMAKNPDDRYQSTREILRDLAKVRDNIAGGQEPNAANQPQALSLAISNAEFPVADGSEQDAQVQEPRLRSAWWILLAVGCVAAAIGGALIAGNRNPRPDQQIVPNPTTNNPGGLPEIRPPEKIVTMRERELMALLSKKPTPEKMLKGSIELGLLYVRERRFEEAKETFEQLELAKFDIPKKPDGDKKPDADSFAARHTNMAGRLGQAVVLAHSDNAAAAQASNDLVLKVLNDPFPRSTKFDKADRGYSAVTDFLLRYPDTGLAQSLADALNHNAATLGRTRLEPAALEQLRTPLKGGK
jgi:eukaryotic-like serine/threonine-protein kinase